MPGSCRQPGELAFQPPGRVRQWGQRQHGITAGREMSIEGRVLVVDGERRMYNPRYSLIAEVAR